MHNLDKQCTAPTRKVNFIIRKQLSLINLEPVFEIVA